MLITQGLSRSHLFSYDFYAAYTGCRPPDHLLHGEEAGEEKPRLLFRATAFNERIEGFFGVGEKANCTDIAYMVMALANSIGCRLKAVKLSATDATFDLNEAIPIGFAAGERIIPNFSYHEFLWMGEEFSDSALIFDASLGFEGEGTDCSLNPVAGLPFGDLDGQSGYFSRLVADPNQVQVDDPEDISLKIN